MGFSWISTGADKTIKAEHVNEIKANIDSVLADLDSSFSWSELPVSIGQEMTHDQWQEMRDAVDYADDQNYCHSDNATAKTGDDATADIGYDNNLHGTVYSGQDSGYDSDLHSPYDSGVESAIYGDHCPGMDSGEYYPDYANHCHPLG